MSFLLFCSTWTLWFHSKSPLQKLPFAVRKARIASARPRIFLQDYWEGALSLTTLCFPFYNYFLCSYSLFCFCFSPRAGSFVQTDLPLWTVSVSTNCHPVTPRQKKCLGKLPTTSSLGSAAHFIPKSWAKQAPNHPWVQLPPCQGIPCERELAPWSREGIWMQAVRSSWRWQPGLKLGRVLFSVSDKDRIMMLCLVLIYRELLCHTSKKKKKKIIPVF